MSVNLYDAINEDGLFNIFGKVFNSGNTLNTARGTTVPTDVEEIFEWFKNIAGGDTDFQRAIDALAAAHQSWQAGGATLTSGLVRMASNLLIEFVKADSDAPKGTLTACLEYIIAQMLSDGDYVDPNAITLTLTTDPDSITNIGDVAILYTELRGDGRVQENAIPEAIDIEVTSDSSAVSPSLAWNGERATNSRLHQDWPTGSAVVSTLSAADPANSLLSNGNFENTTIRDIPDNWIITTGAPGSTVVVTQPEEQTVVISGTPTGGTYILHWIDRSGIQRTTDPLAYNATGSSVQSALRELAGLSAVTVAATGTSPNFTHTITFTDVAGNLNQLTSTSLLTGGTPVITHATTLDGTDGAYKGRALALASNGSEETTLHHRLDLNDEVVYFCHLRVKKLVDADQSSSSSSSSSSPSSSSSSSSINSSSSTSSVNSSSSSSSINSSSSSSSGVSSSSSSSVNSSSSSTSSANSSSSSSLNSSSSSSSVNSSSSSSINSSSSSSSRNSSSSSPSSPSSSSSVNSSSSSSVNSSSSSSPSSWSSQSSSSSSSSVNSSSSSSEAAEELRIEIVEGIGSQATVDAEGNVNQLRIDVGSIGQGDHDSEFFSFRLRRDVVQPVYLRIHLAAPPKAGDVIYIDEMVVVAATELYKGGPFVGAVSGATAAVVEDNWSLTVANNRAGSFQEWFHRAFDMAGKNLLLPSSGSGTNYPDALIA